MTEDYELDILFKGLNVSTNNLLHLIEEPPSDLNIQFNSLSLSNNELQIFFNIENNNNLRLWSKIEFCITVEQVYFTQNIIYKIWYMVNKFFLKEFTVVHDDTQYNGHYGENGIYVEFDTFLISAEEAGNYGKHTQLLFSLENYNNIHNKWKKLDFCITVKDVVLPMNMSAKILTFVDELINN